MGAAMVVRDDCWCMGAASPTRPRLAHMATERGGKLRCRGLLSMRPRHANAISCAPAPWPWPPALRCPAPHPSPHVCARVGGRVRLSAVGARSRARWRGRGWVTA
jgi:hypothetical protein